MKRLRRIYRELQNYVFLQKVLRKEISDPTSEWQNFKLRKNWYGRIYTVVSLREEDMGEEETVRNWKAMEMMKSVNAYLTKLDLQEIIFPSIEKIPDSRSYLVVYSPLFKDLTFSWAFWRLIIISGIGIILNSLI